MSLSTENNNTKIRKNRDIEEILSDTYDVGTNIKDNELKIKKINTSSPIDVSVERKISDKIELSSNKDVDFGLDLLVNKEKVAEKKEDNNLISNAYDISSTNLGSEKNSNYNNKEVTSQSNEDTTSRIEEMIKELGVDKQSRLSQDDIDKLIDNSDNTSRNKPKLVNQTEIEDMIENTSKENNNKKGYSTEEQSGVGNFTSDEEGVFQHRNGNGFKQQPYSNQYAGFPNAGFPNAGFPNVRPTMHAMAHNMEPRVDYAEVRKKKQELLFKLEKMRRLNVQGIKKFNMSSKLEDMQEEYDRVKHEREIESSVKFQRKCLMAMVTGAELLNNKLDFLDFKLDGWSEQVNENIDEYNEVFEELHEKYKERAKLAPEFKLLFMLGGSAFMYHLSNSMFKNSIPGMEDIMKQNPELMKQFAKAAINQMGNEDERNAANFMFNNAPQSQNSMPRRPPPQMRRRSPGMPGIPVESMNRNMPSQYSRRMVPESTSNVPGYRPGPEPSVSSENFVNESSSNISQIDKSSTKVNTPFNNSSKIVPPVGVDDILNELRSNTSSIKDNDDISEVLSQGNKNKTFRKKGKNRRRRFNLTVGE
jgi:hypothetical protein